MRLGALLQEFPARRQEKRFGHPKVVEPAEGGERSNPLVCCLRLPEAARAPSLRHRLPDELGDVDHEVRFPLVRIGWGAYLADAGADDVVQPLAALVVAEVEDRAGDRRRPSRSTTRQVRALEAAADRTLAATLADGEEPSGVEAYAAFRSSLKWLGRAPL